MAVTTPFVPSLRIVDCPAVTGLQGRTISPESAVDAGFLNEDFDRLVGDYPSPYTSRLYAGAHGTEVSSTGFESFATSEEMVDGARRDLGHFCLTLGGLTLDGREN